MTFVLRQLPSVSGDCANGVCCCVWLQNKCREVTGLWQVVTNSLVKVERNGNDWDISS